jgi:hypothetical protein
MEKDHVAILLEDIRGKFELVLEGHASLHAEIQSVRREVLENVGQVDFKIDTLNRKMDAVAAELAAHRADTEAHHGIYRVREGNE